jgi:hypothetical protein
MVAPFGIRVWKPLFPWMYEAAGKAVERISEYQHINALVARSDIDVMIGLELLTENCFQRAVFIAVDQPIAFVLWTERRVTSRLTTANVLVVGMLQEGIFVGISIIYKGRVYVAILMAGLNRGWRLESL